VIRLGKHLSLPEKVSRKQFRRPRPIQEKEEEVKYIIEIRDRMHNELSAMQEKPDFYLLDKKTGDWLVEYTPVRNLIRLAEHVANSKRLAPVLQKERLASESLKKNIESLLMYINQRPVIARHLKPYLVFPDERTTRELIWNKLNRLIMDVHQYALSKLYVGIRARYCGCIFSKEADVDISDEFVRAVCEGAKKAEVYKNRVDLQQEYEAHRSSFVFETQGSNERRILFRHAEFGGNRCSRGRLLALKYGMTLLINKRGRMIECGTDKTEDKYLWCRFYATPRLLRALALFLGQWSAKDLLDAKMCQQLLRRALVLAYRIDLVSARAVCHPSFFDWVPVDDFETMSRAQDENDLPGGFVLDVEEAGAYFGVSDPGPIEGRLGGVSESEYISVGRKRLDEIVP